MLDQELLNQFTKGREQAITWNGSEWADKVLDLISRGLYERRDRKATAKHYICWRVVNETGQTQAWVYKMD